MFASRRRRARADAVTLGIAGLAAATAGTVMVGELLRLGRRRRRQAAADPSLAGAGEALVVAGEAAQDTVNVAIEGYGAAPRAETVLFNVLSGFLAGFALIRFSAYSIRRGWNPFGSVRLRGRHVHHFVPGILLAFVSGGVGLVTQSERLEEFLAFPFGAGIGLTFDEAALLLELEDVYWTREGLLSIQASLGLSALLGATIIGLRMLRRGEQRSEARGLIPEPVYEPLWRTA